MVLTHSDYSIGWISAIPVEHAAAKAMMDRPLHPLLDQDAQDSNAYTLGQIGNHNVVLAISPRTGIGAAAHAAANLLRSFPNIRFGLMVGIGGGVPGSIDIRLGDIVVSYPEEQHGGVVQYDLVTKIQESEGSRFIRKGHLDKPPPLLLATLRNLQSNAIMEPLAYQKHYEEMLERHPQVLTQYSRPEIDELYLSEYLHCGQMGDCSHCAKENIVTRTPRSGVVHYGLIGSANTLLRSAITRDKLCKEGIICVEMESAGLMNEFPCVVIRGISDYCDSHKSDQWQAYSSAIAAAYAKELLLNIAPRSVNNLPRLDSLEHLVEKQVQLLQNINNRLNATESAAVRIRHKECLKDLHYVNPRLDKDRLEDIKGGLLRDAYKWILQTSEYTSWQKKGGILWIRGHPGKGKTMLLCGIIDELEEHNKLYFFCQNTINTNNTAISVLRGLIYMALQEDATLSEVLSDRITEASTLPQDSAFFIYAGIIDEILESKQFDILVDALDECLSGQDMLLRFIIKCSTSHSSRWLVTSRNNSGIDDRLHQASQLSLELNESSVSEAVHFFIKHKTRELAQSKGYDNELQAFVLQYLLANAKGTFLWVSLVCSGLFTVQRRHARAELLRFQPGLTSVYDRMLGIIEQAKDADKLKEILGLVCIAFRPMTLGELRSLVMLSTEDFAYIKDFVDGCGSFLLTRMSTIEFVHQSAKDFLMDQDIVSRKIADLHHQVFIKSLDALKLLRRNMYSLTDPGVSLDEIDVPNPDPLGDIKYVGLYWVDHLLQVYEWTSVEGVSVADAELITEFFKTKALYWIELLSLLRQVYPMMLTLSTLRSAFRLCSRPGQSLPPDSPGLEALISDTIQFLQYFQYALVRFPMQVYISGLLFCPSQSLIKNHFRKDYPIWSTVERGLEQSWPSHLALDTHASIMQWSDNGEMLATRSNGNVENIYIWDTNSGQLLTIVPDNGLGFAFADSDTILLVVSQFDAWIRSWSTKSGELLETRTIKDSGLLADAYALSKDWGSFVSTFSKDTSLVARGRSWLPLVEIHCTNTGSLVHGIALRQTEDGRSGAHNLVFSGDNLLLAVETRSSVFVLDAESGEHLWSRTSSDSVHVITFSGCSTMLALVDERLDHVNFEIRNWQNDTPVWNLLANKTWQAIYQRIAFLNDRILVANGAELQEWDLKSSSNLKTCISLPTLVTAISVNPRGEKIAIRDNVNIKVWNLDKIDGTLSTTNGVLDIPVLERVWLKDRFVYTISRTDVTKIRKVSVASEEGSNITMGTLKNRMHETEASMSPSWTNVAIWSGSYGFEIWDLHHTDRVLRINCKNSEVTGMAWGPDEAHVVIARQDTSFRLECWSISKKRIVRRLPSPFATNRVEEGYTALLCSSKGSYLLLSCDLGLYLWTKDQARWSTLGSGQNFHCYQSRAVFSNNEALFACIAWRRILMVFKTKTKDMLFSIGGHDYSSLLVFDVQWLKTDQAWYAIPHDVTDEEDLITQPAEHLNLEADPSKEISWVRSGTDNIIWLPPDYRPKADCWDVDGSRIAIGRNATQIVLLNVHWDRSRGLNSLGQEGQPAPSHKWRRSSLAMLAHRQRDRRFS